ncbi:MAG: relaxase/mobilization nuclease domain-containing protein [Maribacter sp.]
MIGKGQSISHTSASMSYGWNQEKNAEVVFRQHLVGANPNEITAEFKRIQALNTDCKRNTLSFVLSPTIKDGKRLKNKDLEKIVSKFMRQMKLKDRQAIAFVHRDKSHAHVHLYVNRIDFNGKAYADSFVGKRSQHAAELVAQELKLTTVKQVQFEREFDTRRIRNEIKRRHELTLKQDRPQSFSDYVKGMASKDIKVEPSINKQGGLQGFRFQFKGHDFKGSEVHRSMSMGNIGKHIVQNTSYEKLVSSKNTVRLLEKTLKISQNMALSLAKKTIKRTIEKGIGI